MLTGDIQLVGNGKVRDVYFAEYRGKKVVVKTLRHVNGLQAQKKQLGMHRREIVTLDAVSSGVCCTLPVLICRTVVVPQYEKLLKENQGSKTEPPSALLKTGNICSITELYTTSPQSSPP